MRESMLSLNPSRQADSFRPTFSVKTRAAVRPILQRSARQSGEVTMTPAVRESLGSAGRPLEPSAQSFMEARFGHDLSGVRVHTDSRAAEAAHSLSARAYTVGRDIYFGRGQFRPGTNEGDRLLAHELTHTLQQGPPPESVRAQAKLEVGRPGDASELEADTVADAVMSGSRAPQPRQRPVVAARKAISLAPMKSNTGEFTVSGYAETDDDPGNDTDKRVGGTIDITFHPNDDIVTDKISFVQIMRTLDAGKPFLFENEKPRATRGGWAVDRLAGMKSPNYAQQNTGAAGGNTIFGYRNDATDFKDAWMHDAVSLDRSAGKRFSIEATTFALDNSRDEYLGGVAWGFQTDKSGKTTKKTASLASKGNPRGVQKSALKKWNEQAANTDLTKRNAPDQLDVPVP